MATIDATLSWHCSDVRSFDPRHWYLAPAASLLVACGPPGIPGDDEVADDTTDNPEESPPDCYTDADCPNYYICNAGVCEYEGEDWTDYSDYSDWYEEGPWYECYADYDCSFGYVCVYNYCQPAPTNYPIDCQAPVPEQLPLPDLGGPALELSFVDVDDDGGDELIVVRSTGVVVVMGEDIVINSWPAPVVESFGNLVALDLEPTGPRDFAVFSEQDGGVAWLFHGDGAGGLSFAGTITEFPAITSPRAIDPELDGVDTLVGIAGINTSAVLFDNIAGLSNELEVIEPSSVTEVHTGLLDGNNTPDLLLARDCIGVLNFAPAYGVSVFVEDLAGTNNCTWVVDRIANPQTDEVITLINDDFKTVVGYRPGDPPSDAILTTLWQRFDSGQIIDIDTPSLLMVNSSDVGLMWSWAEFPHSCFGLMPIAGAQALAVGDLEGDGRQEFALLDPDGSVRLYRMP